MKLVLVTWHDALAIASWTKCDEPMEPQVCNSIGYLVSEDSHHVRVATTVSDDEFIAAIQIPKGMIRQIIEIEAPLREG
jgi:hypothetical protein